jgi:hypothetical protein
VSSEFNKAPLPWASDENGVIHDGTGRILLITSPNYALAIVRAVNAYGEGHSDPLVQAGPEPLPEPPAHPNKVLGDPRDSVEGVYDPATGLVTPVRRYRNAEPAADAEVAQAERAVIEAAMAYWAMMRAPVSEADEWVATDFERRCVALSVTRQRSAAAKEPS